METNYLDSQETRKKIELFRKKLKNNHTQQRELIKAYPRIFSCSLLDVIVNQHPCLVGLLRTLTDETGSNCDKNEQKIVNALKKSNYDLIVAPEYSFVPYARVFDENQKDEILERIISASKGHKTLVIPGTFLWKKNGMLYNTLYAICDGKQVFEYDKINDGGELKLAEFLGLTYNPGNKEGFFKWNGVNIGVEICADAQTLAKSRIFCDIHLLVSCGRQTTFARGKYLIINDGDDAAIKVKRTGIN